MKLVIFTLGYLCGFHIIAVAKYLPTFQYQASGEVVTTLTFKSGHGVVQRDSFKVTVSNSSWQIQTTPIEWLEDGVAFTPKQPYQSIGSCDGSQFYHEIRSEASKQQIIVGAEPVPFGVPASSMYILWYGLASGSFLKSGPQDGLPPARQMQDKINMLNGYKVPGRYELNSKPPFLPTLVALPLGKYELGDAPKSAFYTNCIIRSRFDPESVTSLSLPSEIVAEFIVYDSLVPAKGRKETDIVVSVKNVQVLAANNSATQDFHFDVKPLIEGDALVSDLRPVQNGVGPAVGYADAAHIPDYGNSARVSKQVASRENSRGKVGIVIKVALYGTGGGGLLWLALQVGRNKPKT